MATRLGVRSGKAVTSAVLLAVARGLRSSFRQLVEESARGEDSRAEVAPELKQMAIAGDQEVRLCRNGAFERTVVCRIRDDGKPTASGRYETIGEAAQSLLDVIRSPTELGAAEDTCDLFQNEAREVEVE